MQLTDATVVEVEAGLGAQAAGGHGAFSLMCQVGCPCPCPPRGGDHGHVPGSQSAWGLCSQQHTAHGSSRWAGGPYSGHSHWHRQFASLSGKGQDEDRAAAWAPDPHQRHLLERFLSQGRHPRPGIPPLPCHLYSIQPCPPDSGPPVRLTTLTILGAFTPAVGGFTSWRTRLAWGEHRETVRETETRRQKAQRGRDPSKQRGFPKTETPSRSRG